MLPVALIILALALPTGAAADDVAISEIVVTGQRRDQPLEDFIGNIDRLDAETIDAVRHQHIYELLTRVSGVWVSRGSGQEHLTAIRSPVLTGAGSCGGFLFLEDGIPIRPSGFCNVNQLFEINSEQARSIEVIRGPGNALYGSNALHGTINVLMPDPGNRPRPSVSLEAGANDFLRFEGEIPGDPDAPYYAGLVYADDGGFRDDSGYRQGKLHAKGRTQVLGGDFIAALSLTDLEQETAGYVLGEDAYEDPDLNRTNPNPEAYRNASSQRLYGTWRRSFDGVEVDLRPFLRHSDMDFLQHFLPGQPVEENGQFSAGMLSAFTFDRGAGSTVAGVDVEWADTWLEETQYGPTEGSPFLQETRPQGKHYDYDVTSWSIAPYVQAEFQLGSGWNLGLGLRAEYVHYDYDNRMLDGNTRDDGSECGFGGCLYTRPADRSDDFTNLAPKLSAGYRLSDTSSIYLAAGRGFRPPQMTELYRLQSGQTVADLDSERIDSVEIGWRRSGERLFTDVAVFAMQKRDSVIRDAQGYNVNGGRTRHHGVEAELDWQIAPDWSLSVDATWARHVYDFDTVAAQGETFVSGNDVDTSPRWFGSAELLYDSDRVHGALQWTGMDAYFVDAENLFTYPGHSLLNLRLGVDVSHSVTVTLRLNNLTDEYYADRADYAFGNYRYFPGPGRELFVELRYFLGASG